MKKDFKVKQKAFFIFFKGLSDAKKECTFKLILNNFVNGYLIFICSYSQAEFYSVGLWYVVNETQIHNF